jgi:osmoprotectant transport system substrate-binding protein
MKRTRAGLLGAVMIATLGLAACGSSGSSSAGGGSSSSATTPSGAKCTASAAPTTPKYAGTGTVTVGSAAFPENVLLANIYADAMSAKGVTVKKQLSIGERPVYIKALNDGSIDVVPEYSGSILQYFCPDAALSSSDQVFAALQGSAPDGLSVLKYAAAEDRDSIVVTKDTASKYNLTSIADLAAVAGKMTLGAPAQFKTRADGVPGLAKIYSVTFKGFKVLDPGGPITIQNLKNGTVQAVDMFSTDPAIAANGFVALQDPKDEFAAQNVLPLVTNAKVSQTAVDAMNAVSVKLDQDTLNGLVAKVQTDKKDPDAVAKEWLSSVGLG